MSLKLIRKLFLFFNLINLYFPKKVLIKVTYNQLIPLLLYLVILK